MRAATAAARTSIGVSTATTASTGPLRTRSRSTLASRSPGSTRTTRRRSSGRAPSLPTTTSSPSRPAATRKAVAREGRAGTSSSTRAIVTSAAPYKRSACPGSPPRGSALLGREKRRGPRRVVGDVGQADQLGNARPQQRLDALADGHLGQAAALATALQADADPALVDLDQGHPTAVRRDHRIDLRIQDIAHPVGEALAATRPWRVGVG